jgi:chromosome segregation ATPase
MADEPKLRRSLLRGYKRGDVELALARATITQEQMQHELEGTKARANAMHAEIKDLHRRLDANQTREKELAKHLEEIRERHEQMEREATSQAQSIVDEAKQKASAYRAEGLRQVGELQQQVEQLLGMRAGLSAALKRVTADINDSLDRLAAAPARAIEQPPPAAPPIAPPEDTRFARWSDETES